jgi:hypothetical protein
MYFWHVPSPIHVCPRGNGPWARRDSPRPRLILTWPDRSLPLADGAGVGAAISCALHCLLTPWLVGVLPLLAPVIATKRTEAVFLVVSLALSGGTLLSARLRVHICWRPIAMFAAAGFALAGARAMGVVEEPLGRAIVGSAACLITAAHCANVRCCRDTVRVRPDRGPFG